MCTQKGRHLNELAKLNSAFTRIARHSLATRSPASRLIQGNKAKGKSATKTQEAADELACLMTFNQSITQAMAMDCISSMETTQPPGSEQMRSEQGLQPVTTTSQESQF